VSLLGVIRAGPLRPGAHAVDVAGISQRYHVAGTGPVCVVHPGGPGVGWEYLRMPDLERALTLVYLEPVGTGESGRLPDPRDYNVPTYLRFLHAVVEHLGMAQVTLLGHSHGGLVAQRYALEHPGRVSRLVLYATTPVIGPEFSADALRNVRLLAARHPGRPEAADIAAAFAAGNDSDGSDDRSAAFRRIFPAYFADYWARESEFAPVRARMRAWRGPTLGVEPAPLDTRAALPGLTIPAAVITGARDIVCGPAWAGLLHRALPGSRLRILDGSGHFPHLEQPGEFTAEVTGFLDRPAG
jgi:pimeloyl-ACP methyl ester carboxylesterase